MGMDLFGEKDAERNFRFGIGAWSKLLELAEVYGWEPAGTVAKDGTHHPMDDNGYFCNSGFLVTKKTAKR